MTFEKNLMKEIDEKRDLQWKICQDWEMYFGKTQDCKIYNKGYCPLRCDYAQEMLRGFKKGFEKLK